MRKILKEKIKGLLNDNKKASKSRISEEIKSAPIIHIISSVQESEKIAIEMMKGKSVIINLSNIGTKEKYRVIDFLSGVIFVMQGKRVKLEKNIYLFTPMP